MLTHAQLSIKRANLNQFLELNNILLFLTCVSKCIILIQNVKKRSHLINPFLIKLLSFQVNKVYINVYT